MMPVRAVSVCDAVERYVNELHRHDLSAGEGVYTVPTGAHIKDNEQALYMLLQCGHNIDEAVDRHRSQAVTSTDPMTMWTEEECRSFENGLRTYGKDFFQIQQNKVRTRSVSDLVQFYYLWKKTERHDAFAARTRLEKKRYALHPGITDYMDRFLDDQESPTLDRISLPAVIVADCEQTAGQQRKLVLAVDDNKSGSQIDTDTRELDSGDATETNVANGDGSLSDSINKTSDLSTAEPDAGHTTDCTSLEPHSETADIKEYASDSGNTSTNTAEATVPPGSQTNTCSKLETTPCASPEVADPASTSSELQADEQLQQMAENDSAKVADVDMLHVKKSVDSVSEIVSHLSDEVTPDTAVASCDQQHVDDNKSISDVHLGSTDCKLDECPKFQEAAAGPATSNDTEPPVSAELHAAEVGRAETDDNTAGVDEVQPGDVEVLLAAVDSATSDAGSVYSNVDPLTAALEFSASADCCLDVLSKENVELADTATQQADSVPSCAQSDKPLIDSNSQPSECTVLQNMSDDSVPTCDSNLSVTEPTVLSNALKNDNASNLEVVSEAAVKDDRLDAPMDSGTLVLSVANGTDGLLLANHNAELPEKDDSETKDSISQEESGFEQKDIVNVSDRVQVGNECLSLDDSKPTDSSDNRSLLTVSAECDTPTTA